MSVVIKKLLFGISIVLMSLSCSADSLFDPGTFRSALSDRKAFQLGDSLTVLIYENASAQTSAGNTSEKSGGPSLKLRLPTSTKDGGLINLEEDFTGKGKIERSGKLLGTITVVVQSVESNGDLNIKGEQQIEINEDKQSIKLEGRVRPMDILENNSVVSARIANAKISYVGDGWLASRQHPGVLTRLFSMLGLL
ncbi:MAG: flagellar basal body L-ring protein FlgH [Pseudomonadota bacterium]